MIVFSPLLLQKPDFEDGHDLVLDESKSTSGKEEVSPRWYCSLISLGKNSFNPYKDGEVTVFSEDLV